ncbi:MAG: hypothetical protein Q8L37_06010 [Candidatus Gottesmanbacteria bacterium]|nr:hypothetical protein [Candidatus Gottesmanbacteria bacterium]
MAITEIARKNPTDWAVVHPIIFDLEGMTRVTAICDNGHKHVNLPVAKKLANPNELLPQRCGVQLENNHFCNSWLKVAS